MGKTSTVLNIISSVMVSVNQNCITTAANSAILEFGKAKVVNINGLTIASTISNSQNCTVEQNVQIGPLHDELKSTLLDHMRTAANAINGDTVSLVTNISESITATVVSSCMATAINSLNIDIQNVPGKITIHDVNISQKATASIAQCLTKANIRVGNVPLQNFIEDNEPNFDLVNVPNTDDNDGGAANGKPKPIDLAKLPKSTMLRLGGMCLGVLVYIVILFIAILYFKGYILHQK